MTILCIETSTAVCSAAICKDGVPCKQCINYEGSNHARLLPLYIEQLFLYARENALKIDAVALSEGPGSYTGLRIGTATAKGICYGLNIPLIPVPTLEIMTFAARSLTSSSPKDGLTSNSAAVFVPMIDARRMEVYTNVMANGEWLNGERAKAVVVENEESLFSDSPKDDLTAKRSDSVSDLTASAVYYFGDGAAKCQKVITSPNWHYIPNIVPEAQFVGMLAENRKSIIDNRTPIDIAYYEPYYLKEFVAAQSHVKGLV
jgi:tRNA threonylcarbamoyladenosine biosynthesis protein TsaB